MWNSFAASSNQQFLLGGSIAFFCVKVLFVELEPPKKTVEQSIEKNHGYLGNV